jgi:hypothetical protein
MEAGMDIALGLLLYCGNNLWVAVPHIIDTNAAGEIYQFSSVNIRHDGTSGFGNE